MKIYKCGVYRIRELGLQSIGYFIDKNKQEIERKKLLLEIHDNNFQCGEVFIESELSEEEVEKELNSKRNCNFLVN